MIEAIFLNKIVDNNIVHFPLISTEETQLWNETNTDGCVSAIGLIPQGSRCLVKYRITEAAYLEMIDDLEEYELFYFINDEES